MLASSAYSKALLPSGPLMSLSAPCGGEDTPMLHAAADLWQTRGGVKVFWRENGRLLNRAFMIDGNFTDDAAARRWGDERLYPSTVWRFDKVAPRLITLQTGLPPPRHASSGEVISGRLGNVPAQFHRPHLDQETASRPPSWTHACSSNRYIP